MQAFAVPARARDACAAARNNIASAAAPPGIAPNAVRGFDPAGSNSGNPNITAFTLLNRKLEAMGGSGPAVTNQLVTGAADQPVTGMVTVCPACNAYQSCGTLTE